jgi:hypothetical protein
MLRVLSDLVVDSRSNPLSAGISGSRPSQKRERPGAHCGGDAGEIKKPGPPTPPGINHMRRTDAR